jgi:hypothetical protein
MMHRIVWLGERVLWLHLVVSDRSIYDYSLLYEWTVLVLTDRTPHELCFQTGEPRCILPLVSTYLSLAPQVLHASTLSFYCVHALRVSMVIDGDRWPAACPGRLRSHFPSSSRPRGRVARRCTVVGND